MHTNRKSISIKFTIAWLCLMLYGNNQLLAQNNRYNLQVQSNHFATYIQWDSVSMFHRLFHNGTEAFDGPGTDTWLLTAPGSHTVELEPWDSSGRKLPRQRFSFTVQPAATRQAPLVGDYTPLTRISVVKGIVQGHRFVPADVGKVISIKDARRAPWYRQAPLWYHGFIEQVLPNGTALVTSKSVDGKPVGTPSQELIDVQNTTGYFATNNAEAWWKMIESSTQPETLEIKGTAYIDPFRWPWFVEQVVAKVTTKTGPYLTNPALAIQGNLVFGEEHLIGHVLKGTTFTPWRPQFYPLTAIMHQSGFLWVNGQVRGPLTPNLFNQSNNADSRFYQRDTKSTATVQFIFSGTFGDTTNWELGFNNLAENIRGEATSGKDLQAAINARIACPEPFALRPFAAMDGKGGLLLRPNFGKRWLLRNVTFYGSAMRKANGPVLATVRRAPRGDSLLVTVDARTYPEFTFREFAFHEPQFLIFKEPGKPVGPLNQFDNAIFEKASFVASPYSVSMRSNKVKPGTYMLATSPNYHERLASQGHIQYSSALLEVEVRNVLAHNLHSFFLRSNNNDYFGWHRQFSLINARATPTKEDRFKMLRPFGGYDMWIDFPSTTLQAQYVAQGFKGVALVRNTDVRFQQNRGLVIYQTR